MHIPKSLIATQERLDWFFRPKTFLVFVLIIAVGMYIGFTGLAQFGDLLIAWGYVLGPIVIILALLCVPLESKHDDEKATSAPSTSLDSSQLSSACSHVLR